MVKFFQVRQNGLRWSAPASDRGSLLLTERHEDCEATDTDLGPTSARPPW